MPDLLDLSELSARHLRKPTADDWFACPTGPALWEAYRTAHSEGRTNPLVLPEDVPDAPLELRAYRDHINGCGNCLEL